MSNDTLGIERHLSAQDSASRKETHGFETTKAYTRLLETGIIDKHCNILKQYFRLRIVEGSGADKKVTHDIVYRIYEPLNKDRFIMKWWDGISEQYSDISLTFSNSSRWADRNYIISPATEAEFKDRSTQSS